MYLIKAIKAATDLESDAARLSGMSVITMEGTAYIFSCFCILSLSIGYSRLIIAIDCFLKMLCRVILFSNLFFLKKWESHF